MKLQTVVPLTAECCMCTTSFQATDLNSQITQSPHPLPISEADGLDTPLRPVLEYLEHTACRQEQTLIPEWC